MTLVLTAGACLAVGFIVGHWDALHPADAANARSKIGAGIVALFNRIRGKQA